MTAGHAGVKAEKWHAILNPEVTVDTLQAPSTPPTGVDCYISTPLHLRAICHAVCCTRIAARYHMHGVGTCILS